MFALRIELLSGRYVATAYNDRDSSEWPPHPARLFSALVDAWSAGDPRSGDGEVERMALLWLEQQAPPSIVASASADVAHRAVVTVFVPVNDIGVVAEPRNAREKLELAEHALHEADGKAAEKAKKALEQSRKKLTDDTRKNAGAPSKVSATDLEAARSIFPENRLRQARTFPSVTPADPSITFAWETTPEPRLRLGLDRLTSRVSRIGHSSSLVFVRCVDDAGRAQFVPDPDGELILRGTSSGQMDRLIGAHAQHQQVEPRVLPCTFIHYREGTKRVATKIARSVFSDDWIILSRVAGPRLPGTSSAGISRQLRRALIAAGDGAVPEILSGHRADGGAIERDHLAILPLIDAGHKNAQGTILGVALVPPRSITEPERRSILRALGLLEQQSSPGNDEEPLIALHLGRSGVLTLERIAWGEHRNRGLRSATWCRPSCRWASATPVALDRNPGDLHDNEPARRSKAFEEATSIVCAAVERIGLPRPEVIDVVRSCVLAGSAKPRSFPRFPPDDKRPQRVLVHVRLQFTEPVRGPIVIGAGRYQGLGILKPVDETKVQGDAE